MVTRSMAAMKSAFTSVKKVFQGSNGNNNEDGMKEEPTEPAEEEDEQITEVQFASLMESISEDEIVVR